MTAYTNNFNAYTSGTTVTAANSTTSGSPAFTVAQPPTGGTLTAATAAAFEGTNGLQIVYPAGTSTQGYVAWWNVVTTTPVRASTSFWYKFSALPALDVQMLYCNTPSMYLTTSGQLQPKSGATVIGTSTAVTPGTWLFIQFAATTGSSSTNGRIECNVYKADGTRILNVDTGTTTNAGGGIDFNYGRANNVTAAYTASYDLLNASNALTTGFPGPPPPSAGGNVKVWTGTAFTAKPVKVWTGSAWVVKPVKRWSGTAWVTTTY